MPLPSIPSVWLHRTPKSLEKKNAVVQNMHVFVILNIDIMKKGVLNNFESVSLMFL